MSVTNKPIISADSHIAEPPNCYTDYIEPAFKDRAPHVEVHPKYGGAMPVSTFVLAAGLSVSPEKNGAYALCNSDETKLSISCRS